MDSLTFHAKRQLYNYALNRVFKLILPPLGHQQQQPSSPIFRFFLYKIFLLIFLSRLPSPALVESIARLLLSTELCDQDGANFFYHALLTLKPVQNESQNMFLARNDFLALLLELLNFRLQNIGFGWKWDFGNRISNIIIFLGKF